MEPENIHGTAVVQPQEDPTPVQNVETPSGAEPVATGAVPAAKPEPTELEKLEWRMNKKIGREVGRRKEAEEIAAKSAQTIAELVARLGTDKPKPLDMNDPSFKTPQDYFAAVSRQEAVKVLQEQNSQLSAQAQHQKQVAEFEASWANRVQVAGIKDYVEKMTNTETDFDALQRHRPDVMAAVQNSDVGVELAYHLGTHSDDANKFLAMDDKDTRNRFIARIEYKIAADLESKANNSPAASGKAAPKPTAPATSTPAGGTMPESDPLKMPTDQFAAWLLDPKRRRR